LPNIVVTLLVADAPPVTVPVNVGILQLYKLAFGTIPFVPSVGVTTNAKPLHVTVVIALTSGVGFKVTVNVKFAPTQPAAVLGLTIYVTVCVSFVRLLSVPNIVVILSVADAPPVTVPVNPGSLHVYLVAIGTIPLAPLFGVTTNGTPLHVTVVIALTSGVGLSVTITVNAAPVQLPDNGVTLYVTVWVVFVRLLNKPNTVSGLFEADAPPVTVPVNVGIFQLYKLLSGTIPFVWFVGVTTNGTPLHVTVVIVLISAVGGKVTVNVKFVPTQLAAVLGVII